MKTNTKIYFLQMNKFVNILLLSLLTLNTSARNSERGNKKAAYNLTVECIREPEFTLVEDSKPEFSWVVPDEAIFQKAYHILVSSSALNAANNKGDIWDSGKILSSKSTNVEMGGKPLRPMTTYFWKVRIADHKNRFTKFSAVQKFTTGLLKENTTTQNVFRPEKIKPGSTRKKNDGSYFIDFGKAAFATLELKYSPQKEEELIIRIGEKLAENQIDRNPGGTIRYQEVSLRVTPDKSYYQIKLEADKRNTGQSAVALPDSFPVLMPFRYAEIEGAGTNFNPNETFQLAYFNYFVPVSSSFKSSDSILNQVWDLCKYTIKATTFAGYYVDGDRERIPYEADAYLNQLSHYAVDNEYAMARRTIEYFFNNKPTWPTEWQMHVPMMIFQDYMYTGNTELIKKYYEQLKVKSLMSLEVEDGFISTKSPNMNGEFMLKLGFPDSTIVLKDIVDWPPESTNFGGVKGYQKGEQDQYVFKRINTVVNGFYYHNMRIMAKFATLLNKTNEALDFELRAAKIKKSINEKLFDVQNGYYVDGIGTNHASLHANMILLAFDLVPDSRVKSVVRHIKSRGMACSVYGSQYLLEALYKAGEAQYALDLMSSTSDRSWYNMIRIGSTMTLEAWDMKYKTNSDWNHAWGATPANIIPRYMWGIQPILPGFKLVRIKPQLANLTSCSIVAPTIKGQLTGEFKKMSDSMSEYTFVLPANVVAEFVVNETSISDIKLNGSSVNAVGGLLRLNPGINKIQIILAEPNLR